MSKRVSVCLIAALALAAASIGCIAADEDGQAKAAKTKAPLVFRVSGKAQTEPDSVVIRFAVVGSGESLSLAQQQMQATEQSVIKALDKRGVKRKDMELERFAANSLQPAGIGSPAVKPLGYRVERQYRITMAATAESLDKVLNIADAAMSQGARPAAPDVDAYGAAQPSLMQFTVKDPDKLTKLAMDDALARARKLAEQAAHDMGYPATSVRLIGVTASDSSVACQGYGSDGRTPVASASWQPVIAVVSVEAEFGLMQ